MHTYRFGVVMVSHPDRKNQENHKIPEQHWTDLCALLEQFRICPLAHYHSDIAPPSIPKAFHLTYAGQRLCPSPSSFFAPDGDREEGTALARLMSVWKTQGAGRPVRVSRKGLPTPRWLKWLSLTVFSEACWEHILEETRSGGRWTQQVALTNLLPQVSEHGGQSSQSIQRLDSSQRGCACTHTPGHARLYASVLACTNTHLLI